MTREELGALLDLEERLIPPGKRNRPALPLNLKYVTIHNTDNPDAGADARAHAGFLENTGYYVHNGQTIWVSWHYTVDDRRVVKHLPTNEVGYHAPNGNEQSLGIEICMNQGIDQQAAFRRAARLAAVLLYDFPQLKRSTDRIVTHKYWTGKKCPSLLLNGGMVGQRWVDFKAMVQSELDSIEATL